MPESKDRTHRSRVRPKRSAGRLREAAARRVRSINIHSVTGNNPVISETEYVGPMGCPGYRDDEFFFLKIRQAFPGNES